MGRGRNCPFFEVRREQVEPLGRGCQVEFAAVDAMDSELAVVEIDQVDLDGAGADRADHHQAST